MSPLRNGASKEVISSNIATCLREGERSREQCVAIAFANARRWIEKNLGGDKRAAALRKLRKKND